MRIVVVVAHPDDEAIGMGGTLARFASSGHEVQIIVTTVSRESAARRKQEMFASAATVGIRPPLFLDIPELELKVSTDTEDQLSALIGDTPDAVFTLWAIDVHPDHRNTAVLVVGRFLERGVNTELYAMETCSSGRVSQAVRPQSLAFRPTHYADVSAVLADKRAMVDCHVSQDPEGIWRGCLSMMRNRGAENGTGFAEAFVRLTRVGEPPPWLSSIIKPTMWKLPRGIAPDFEPTAIGL